ncbi:MAG: Ig-like domain-containing protein [Lachnospiraceae bacterium]|nr:Ig-like domain-containing protein [Lachnospiraceae bacterium]
MKRRKLAFALAMAMVMTSAPANALVGYAEEDMIVEDAIMDEEISFDTGVEEAEVSAETLNVPANETEESKEELNAPADEAEELEAETLAEAAAESAPTEAESLYHEEEAALPVENEIVTDDFVESIEALEEVCDTSSYMEGAALSASITSDTETVTVPANTEASYTFNGENDGYFYIKLPVQENIDVTIYDLYESAEEPASCIQINGDGFKAYYLKILEGDPYLLKIVNRSGADCTAQVGFSCLQYHFFYPSVRPGETCTLVAESPEKNITYQWYASYNDRTEPLPIEGESYTNTYTVDSDGETNYYYCDLVDENGFSVRYHYFIHVTSGLTVENEESFVDLFLGGSAVLSVSASHDDEKYGTIRYAWYKYNPLTKQEDLIQNAVAPSLTVNETGDYVCKISDDVEEIRADFYVRPETHLTVSPVPNRYVFVEMGQPVSLSVSASSDAGAGALQYQWMGTEDIDIPGATGVSYTTPEITSNCRITCRVTDGYMHRYAYFDIKVINASDFQNASVLPNGGTVSASLAAGGKVFYKIVPEKTAKYAFYSSTQEDTYAYLCDENKTTLVSDDDGGERLNFRIEYNLTAGKTYYLIAQYLEDSMSGSFNINMGTVCEHQPSYISRIEPTCVTNGSAKARCTICGDEYDDILWATGSHTFGEWTIAQAPTVFADGVSVRTCTVCGVQETTPIAALAPTMTVNTSKIPLKVKQSTTKVKVSGLAAGDYIVSWKSSNTKVAKVNSKGKITAQNKTGKANITITLASGLQKKVQVTVQKGAVKTSKISNVSKKLTLAKGKKYTLAPVITPITTTDKVSYSSSNKKVATVSGKGVITAKGSGKAKITVKSGSKKAVVTVTVPKTAPTGITGVKDEITLKKGKSTTLKPKLSPKGAEAKITYKSSNKKVATVNASGKIVAKKKGTAVITVTAGKVKKTCKVTVK